MEKQLKPCPFCGSDAVHTEPSYFRDTLIYCESCDAYFTVDSYAADEHDVIEAWNRRTDDHFRGATKMIKVEWMDGDPYCDCGQELREGFVYCPGCGSRLDWDREE